MFNKLKRITSGLLATIMLITLIPATLTTTAHAADGSSGSSSGGGDYVGEGQDGVVGEDVEAGSKWDGSSGAWRIYIADESGAIIRNPVDVTNLSEPVGIDYYYMTPKLQSRGYTSLSGVKANIKGEAAIPSVTASQDEVISYWESNNFEKFRVLCGGIGWPADEIIPKVQSNEWFIVIEPVFWLTIRGTYYGMTPTEMAIMDAYSPGYMTYVKNLTHRYAPLKAYFPAGKGKWGIPGAIGSESSMANNNNFYMDNTTMKAQYGIARVEATGGMCCAHNPTNCACYKHATPPNQDPTNAPDKCKCFETHLKDPKNPIPCGPGVPGCDCYPPQCCEHPPNCPCGPGDHPTNDPTCICPETHPNRPCSPDEPDCDCFPHGDQVSTDLVIHEDELTQSLNAKMEAKGTKFQVQSIPAFQPAVGSFKGSSCYCRGYTRKGRHKGDRGYHQRYNWVAATVWPGNVTVQLNENIWHNRNYMGEANQFKMLGLLTGMLDVKYADSQIKDVHTASSGHFSGPTPTGPFDSDNIMYFIGHRQGAGKSPIPIAAYMGATEYNEAYKDFINQRINNWAGYPQITGYQPMEGFTGLTDSGAGSYDFTVKYEASISNSAPGGNASNDTITAKQRFFTPFVATESGRGTCHGCGNMSHGEAISARAGIAVAAAAYQGDYVAKAQLPRVDYAWTVKVDGTVVSTPKANEALQQKETFSIKYNVDDGYLIQSPIPTWKFYPTFKMTADYEPGTQSNKPVWVLAAGERTFNAYDALTIKHQSGRIGMTAPWSRDYEDKQQSVNVAKAGMAYKAESSQDVIQVDAYVTIIDPNYVHPNDRAKVIADNTARLNEYATAIETIVAAPEASWGMYTNMRAGSSKEAAYVVPFVSTDKNQEELVKTQMQRTIRGFGHSNIKFESYRTDGNVAGLDGVVQTPYSFRGHNYTAATVGIPSNWDQLTLAQKNLSALLQKASGKSWYKEDYEGIIVVHMSAQAYLKQGAVTEYTSIYRHESDWQTAFNANSKPLVNQYAQVYKIPKGKYGVGVDFKVPTFTVGGKSVAGLNVGSKIYEFGLRGNVFDDT